MASNAKPPQDVKRRDETRLLRRDAGRGRPMGGKRPSCSLSDSISMEEPNEQSYIKEGRPDNKPIKVCHKRTQYDMDQPGGPAPAGGATLKVANKNVQAGCVLCDPLPEVVKPTNIIVEGVEPVRRSSMRSSDSTSTTPDSSGSGKKSVSFSIRSYRQMPKCAYCITIIILGVVFLSPVIYLAFTSKASHAGSQEESTSPAHPSEPTFDINATTSHKLRDKLILMG
ncbi:uncharacterized protein LOC119162990 isoform X1 [Rhipicephalus microplus]|uniref:uncharacterized protein LOC119162990 isoform X1 n=1 Tax=Rhipicephalus microplus TaxID=6941 RepID=UPI003F6CF660